MENTYSPTIKKGQYTKKVSDNEYQIYHFTTDTNQVTLDEPLSSITTGGSNIPAGTTLQNALQAIKEKADSGGNAATTLDLHISNKNNPHGVTKAQVGLGEVVNKGMDSEPVSGSTNYVTSGGVYDAVGEAIASAANAQTVANNALGIAQGRSSAWVFNGISQLIDGTGVGAFRVGDSVYITASNVSDFWISGVTSHSVVGWSASTESEISAAKDGDKIYVKWLNSYVTLIAVETKTDLSPYLTNSIAADTYVKKNDMPVFTGDVSGVGTYRNGIRMTLSQIEGLEGGTYSAVTVNQQGRVTAGYQMVVFAEGLGDVSLDNLAIGGIAVIEN